jgi:hypothetical protein
MLLMKKVRYAIGVLGVAPALGLMMPAANAGATVTHAQGKPVRTASPGRKTMAVAPLHTCHSGTFTYNSSDRYGAEFSVGVDHYGHCVGYQYARLYKEQTGLTERFRCYNSKGTRIFSGRQPGVIESGVTFFSSSPNVNGAYSCWTALVKNGTSSVQYGPLPVSIK